MANRTDLIDIDGENQAVRAFLSLYQCGSTTIGKMITHMEHLGWDNAPGWAKVSRNEPLSKAGAQLWIRHLFSFESEAQPVAWQPIETAPHDNKRSLYLARIDEDGELVELDFGGAWEYWQESWEMAHINGWGWVSASGIEEPTHWAYQDEPLPTMLSREWQGLSDEEEHRIVNGCKTGSTREVFRAIESALRAKNSGEQA